MKTELSGNTDAIQDRQSILGKLLDNTMKEITQRADSGQTLGLASGFAELDKLLDGFKVGELYILASAPSLGKSSLAMNIASHVAMAGKSVGLITLEMDRDCVARRLLFSQARLTQQDCRQLSRAQSTRLMSAKERLDTARLLIHDAASLSMDSLSDILYGMWGSHGVEFIVIDSLQMLRSGDADGHRQKAQAEITLTLKILARDLKLPILLLAQSSRPSQPSVRPHLPPLIEANADVVMILQCDEHDDLSTRPPEIQRRHMELTVVKNRNGPCGSLELSFIPDYHLFESLIPSYSSNDEETESQEDTGN